MPSMTGRERLLRTFQHQERTASRSVPILSINNVYEMFKHVPTIDDFLSPVDFDPYVKFVEYCDYLRLRCPAYACLPMGRLGCRQALRRIGTSLSLGRETVTIGRRSSTSGRPEGDLRTTQKWSRNSTYLIVWATDEYLIKTSRDFDLLVKYGPPADQIDVSLCRRGRAWPRAIRAWLTRPTTASSIPSRCSVDWRT